VFAVIDGFPPQIERMVCLGIGARLVSYAPAGECTR